jgi:hypothetical protein
VHDRSPVRSIRRKNMPEDKGQIVVGSKVWWNGFHCKVVEVRGNTLIIKRTGFMATVFMDGTYEADKSEVHTIK